MMMHKELALALGALLGSQAQAQGSEAIVVTGSRTEDAAAGFGNASIDAETIELLQPFDTLDLIGRVPGVRAFSKGGAAGPSYLSIRGGEPNFTLVLIDGVKVTDPTNSRGGAFDFGQIDPLALERIEVVKGGLSAVYGADALSGAVSLRLRTLGEDESLASARLTADSEGGHGATLVAGRGWADGALVGGASYADSGDLTEGSDIARGQLFGRLTQRIGPVDLSALALHARADRTLFPEDSGGPRLAVLRERERRETSLSMVGLQASGPAEADWQPRLSFSWSRQRDEANTPAIAPGPVLDGVPAIRSDSRFRRLEATFDTRVRIGEAAEIVAGAAWLRERGVSEGEIDFGFLIPADFRIGRSIASGFVEATARPAERLTVTAGLRYDDPTTARGEWTGRASLRWQPLPAGPRIVGSWSEGYKLPSLYALAYPIIANPDLKPERSRNLDLGIEQDLAGGGTVRIGYFHSRYTDLIDFDPERFTNVNRSRVVASGIEAGAELPLAPTLTARGGLTWLDTDVPPGAPPLRSRPEWEGLAAIEWRPDSRLRIEASGAYTGRFFDSSVPTGLVSLEPRFVVSAAGQYRLSDAAALTLTAENVLGEDYEEAVGFPAPGAVLRIGLLLRAK